MTRYYGTLLKSKTPRKHPLEYDNVQKEVERVYGEQSENDTYYFTRRRVLTASRRKRAYAHPNLRWRGQMYRNQEEKLIDILFSYLTADGANSYGEAHEFLEGNPHRIVSDIVNAWGMAPEDSEELIMRWDHYKKMVRRKLMVRMATARIGIKASSRVPGPLGNNVYDPNYNEEYQDVDPYFEDRNFNEYKEVWAMIPPDGERGYMTQNDNVMNWQVDFDISHRPEVETDQYWGDEPDEFPHIREDNPRVGTRKQDKTS